MQHVVILSFDVTALAHWRNLKIIEIATLKIFYEKTYCSSLDA